jgi:hypothetical protein
MPFALGVVLFVYVVTVFGSIAWYIFGDPASDRPLALLEQLLAGDVLTAIMAALGATVFKAEIKERLSRRAAPGAPPGT